MQLTVSLINLVFRSNKVRSEKEFDDMVSVLIPARNEEKNIKNILQDLQNQEYKNIEIIVFNDLSEDNTEEIIKKYSEQDKRIRLINSKGLPKGWLGKNYACYQLSKHSRGKYLLFLDADVRIKNDIIKNICVKAEKQKLALISIFPKQIMKTPGEKIVVPNMNYILLSLLPLIFVRLFFYKSLAAANGQFMMFNSIVYKIMQPHKQKKSNKVEDIAIANYYKSNYLRVACLTGNNNISCRMYNGFKEASEGFSKNINSFFGDSYFVSIIFWLITTFGIIPVILYTNLKIILLYIFAVILIRFFISTASRQNVLYNLIYMILQQISMGYIIILSLKNKFRKQYIWKGRNIS